MSLRRFSLIGLAAGGSMISASSARETAMMFCASSSRGRSRCNKSFAGRAYSCSARIRCFATTGSSDDNSSHQRKGQRKLLQEITTDLSRNNYRNIIVVNGAGVSTSAGIPDFRTPGTGLYSKLEQYQLPYPEAIFELDYFRTNPKAFATLAGEIWPGQEGGPRPTLTHAFSKVLQDRGMLRRIYTQNIDGLESLAGISDDKLVECHGHFRSCTCISCRSSSNDVTECRQSYLAGTPFRCSSCGDLSKPDIVFFGEELPKRFQGLIDSDMYECDLLIVQGTSLLVNPVAAIPEWVGRNVPRLLINREMVGDFLREERMAERWKDEEDYQGRDMFLEGDCDHGVEALCKLIGEGWADDLTKTYTSLGGM